jgi:mRNA interferase MazF
MPTCEPWSVVVVPFPFTDRRQSRRRPAVVLSPEPFQAEHGCCVLGMVTDARNPRWPSDVELSDLAAAGLRFASVFRCKVFTLDERLILGRVGSLAPADRAKAHRALRAAIV